MAYSKWLARALEQARRDLIDPTRRNRLLHSPLGQNNYGTTLPPLGAVEAKVMVATLGQNPC